MAFTVDSLIASSSPISRPPLAFPGFGSFLPPPPPTHPAASVLQNGLLHHHHHQSTVPFSMAVRNSIPLVSSAASALMPAADSAGCAAVFSSASLPTSLSASPPGYHPHSLPLRTHQYSPPPPPLSSVTSQHQKDLLDSDSSISPTDDATVTTSDHTELTTEVASSPGRNSSFYSTITITTITITIIVCIYYILCLHVICSLQLQ